MFEEKKKIYNNVNYYKIFKKKYYSLKIDREF